MRKSIIFDWMDIKDFEKRLNEWGRQQLPFLFIIDFEMKRPWATLLYEVNADDVLYKINYKSNCHQNVHSSFRPLIIQNPLLLTGYREKYDIVYRHLLLGDSYLTNLTIKTPIDIDISLSELFHVSDARYKMLFENKFLVYSPETFVQIRSNKIFSYPMKGTIDASMPDARQKVLNDEKELAEHCTIVDLIRNDLSQVAENVRVTRFRYLDKINTNNKALLQVSSEIQGDLESNWKNEIGTILIKLLPAGSVSGAPKKKTVQIIREAEGEERGYYTGIVGIFDGESLDTGVMIRFIEQQNGNLYYRSGGGITAKSNCEAEYNEAINKIYVPVNRDNTVAERAVL